MTITEAIQKRHSVRKYTDKSIESGVISELQAEVDKCNAESGMNIRLVTDDPVTFNGLMAKVRFSGAKNFIVLVGKKDDNLDKKAGYYGERLVLKAQQLGLNTCWAAMFSGKKFVAKIGEDEKIVIIISLGYGVTQGVPRKSKPLEALCRVDGDGDGEMPDWFRSGMEAVMLAPTGLNKQPFMFTLSGNTIKAESTGGTYSEIDLGIAKYHFEIGAGTENFNWK